MHASGWVWYCEENEAHARRDNARLRAVLGHCPTGIAVLDEKGNLAGYNERFRSLFSTPPPLGEPVAQIFDEGPRAMLAEVVASAGTEQRAGALISMQATAGAEHEIELLVATLPGDAVRTIGVVMAADDRTARIREEGDRSLLAREIGDANCQRAIGLSQSAMCHDINNVLATLTLTLDVLRRRYPMADPDTGTLLGALDEAVKLGSQIVTRATGRGRATDERRETAMRECVERAAQVVAPLARSGTVTLSVRVLGDARVPLGGTELTQVLTNLLTNSVHAIQDAERPGRVEVTVEPPTSGTVTLRVRDDGVGIEPSRLLDSFEAFETTRAARGGTGLGLAIAREIIEGAGGHIDVLSTPGSGTEMRVELPLAPRVGPAV